MARTSRAMTGRAVRPPPCRAGSAPTSSKPPLPLSFPNDIVPSYRHPSRNWRETYAMPRPTRRLLGALLLTAPLALTTLSPADAASPNFVVAWTGSVQGPYPVGNATAQPELRFAFPDPAKGASDQSFRRIVRPDIWGRQARIR